MWLREHRRKKILETPFPTEWLDMLRDNCAHYAQLTSVEQAALRDLIQVFVAEKRWEGCGGLEMTDEIRVTIAADACLMILALPHDLYRNVDDILVYPSTVVRPPRPIGFFEVTRSPLAGGIPILGEAHGHGPIILTWNAVRHGARHPEHGHNVVFHELAHALDMLDHHADGTPLLDGRADYTRWASVLNASFITLREHAARAEPSVLDAYGATNEAEFFAVATEAFFSIPVRLRSAEPELYEVLAAFYRQDPAARHASSATDAHA